MENKLIKREIFDQIISHLEEKEITIIIGPRQTGKTTLLFQIKEYLEKQKNINPEQIKFFSLDFITDLEKLKNQKEFARYLKAELKVHKKIYIFIDEAQRLENPGIFLKGIYDLNLPLKFIVSGSSALEIKSKIFESLTGRKRVFYLYPFSFEEYLLAKAPNLLKIKQESENLSSIHQEEIKDFLFEYLIFGGYPRVCLEEIFDKKIQILNEIYSSYVEKDVIGFLKIKNLSAFSKLTALLADQVGNLVNINELSNTLKANIKTIQKFLQILEQTFIVYFLRPFFTNYRKELTKMPKVYFIDNGLRNFALKNFTIFAENRDKGKLFENFIFATFLKSWSGSINFWRTKDRAKVDFILSDYFGHKIPIEVKAIELEKPSISRSMKNFIKNYRPPKAFIINLSLKDELKENKTKILFIPFWEIEGELKQSLNSVGKNNKKVIR